jgi:hypothetical protein
MIRPSVQAPRFFSLLPVTELPSGRSGTGCQPVRPEPSNPRVGRKPWRAAIPSYQPHRRAQVGHHLLARIVLAWALDNASAFRDRSVGVLRLNAPRITAELVFEPIAVGLLAAYPEIRLAVVKTDGLVDIVAEGFDAGISRDRRLAPG